MSLLFRLLLGHVIGDFLLQPLVFVLWKRRSAWGIVAHTSVVTLCTALLLAPDLPQLWGSLVVLAVTHAGIDQAKVSLARANAGKRLYLFLADQGLHGLVILILWGAATNWAFAGPGQAAAGLGWWDRVVIYLFGVVVLGWMGPVLEREAVATLAPPRADADEAVAASQLGIGVMDRALGFAERLVGVALMMSRLPLLFPLAFVPRFVARRQEWREGQRALGIKIATSALVAWGVGLLYWWVAP
jgi:hypothetical protein